MIGFCPSKIQNINVIVRNTSLEPALNQHRLSSPSKSTFAKGSFKSLDDGTYKHKLHLVANLGRNVMFHILAVRPWQNNLFNLRPVSSQNLQKK
jgi:hypothetical protein